MRTAALFSTLMATLVIGVGCSADNSSDVYPSKPISVIVPFAPGGGGDTFTRAIAIQAQDILGIKIFVENRAGGSGTIGVGSVARAQADGYTLGFVSSSPIVMAPHLLNVPYDPSVDLTYLARFVVSANPVLARADAPFKSWQELLAFGRANPGKIRWSTSGINGASHVATLAAFEQEGVETTFVPMTGSSEVMAGLLGNTVHLGVISDYAGPLAAGDIQLLAEIGPLPIADMPEVPTFKALNYPLAPTIFFGLAGPAGLPADVVTKWEETMRVIAASDQFKDVAKRLNGEVAYLDHQQFEADIKRDIDSMAVSLRALGIME
jgi:tripartite-type tricarboxylate transporter receptor subunit TctC